jgi:hypothetical protein
MAPEYLSPGVYIEEVEKGTKPIESVGTSTAAFIGESKKGPINQPQLITNWSQFVRVFGDFSDSEYLAGAVYGFFNNGGARCFVTNVSADRQGSTEEKGKSGEGQSKKGSSEDKIARFLGDDKGPGQRTGLNTFCDIPEIALVCAPGQVESQIQDALLAHCEKMKDRFAILDLPEELPSGGLAKLKKPRESDYGSVYFPWIQVYNPAKGNVYFPPSGYIAGVFSRSDTERGVHKAPANEVVRGALGLKYSITKEEQDMLNPKGINCIRAMGDRGIRVWGARTLSSNPSWKYINVRRLFLMVEQSIQEGTQWVVFEPNDETLWKRVTRNVTAYLLRIWRMGALMGQTPEEAFYVKCDEETNPPEVIDAGQLIIEIGLAPVKPAEFVIFRISQMAGKEKEAG